jgi:GNAT superfamily N-acetyltransferase
MNTAGQVVSLSPLDEERFGVRSARAAHVTAAALPSVLDFCCQNDVQFLVARCAAADLPAAQAMEAQGFLLMDTLVYFARDLAVKPVPEDGGRTPIRPLKAGEEQKVAAVAARSFQGYSGHYHADPRLARARCDEAYVSWAMRSCTARDVADEVLVAEHDDQVLGFATLRLNSPTEGEGVLFGVAPEAQGRGIYRSLMVNGMRWCAAKGVSAMVVSTQVTNIAVQKVWTRLGFEPSRGNYTFHKWFR